MSESTYVPARTGLLLVHGQNEFLSDGGKLWPMIKGVAEDVGLLDHRRPVVAAMSPAGLSPSPITEEGV